MLTVHIKADAGDGRLTAISVEYSTGPDDQVIQVPDDFPFDRHMDYRLVEGALVLDPLPEPVAPPTQAERNAADIAFLAMETGVDLDE